MLTSNDSHRANQAGRNIAKVAGTVLASCALLLGGASIGNAESAGEPTDARTMACGFYETSSTAYYGHCGKTTVVIRIEHHNPFTKDWYWCVGPGETRLGTAAGIKYAVYSGGVGCDL